MKSRLSLTICGCMGLWFSGCATTDFVCENPAGNSSCSVRNCNGHIGESGDCQRFVDFSPAAVPVKPGHYLNGWTNAMQCSARSDRLIITRNSWFNGGAELGPAATDNVKNVAAMLVTGTDGVLLEKEPVQPNYLETLAQATSRTQALDQQRRKVIVAALQKSGVTDAENRVHLGPVDELGTRGIEAPQVFNGLFIGNNRGGGQNGNGGQGRGGQGGGFGGGQGF